MVLQDSSQVGPGVSYEGKTLKQCKYLGKATVETEVSTYVISVVQKVC